jgi:hypothetical protein
MSIILKLEHCFRVVLNILGTTTTSQYPLKRNLDHFANMMKKLPMQEPPRHPEVEDLQE